MSKGKKVFRMTISENEILGTIEALQHYRTLEPINRDALSLLAKFEREFVGISYGTKQPAYVQSGKKESSINLDSLGATPVEKAHASMSEDDLEAELERLNQEMLAEQEAAGNTNVILEERRSAPRNPESEGGTMDAALFAAL